jgi:hypothetical protein
MLTLGRRERSDSFLRSIRTSRIGGTSTRFTIGLWDVPVSFRSKITNSVFYAIFNNVNINATFPLHHATMLSMFTSLARVGGLSPHAHTYCLRCLGTRKSGHQAATKARRCFGPFYQ